jgi:hypothetical protein
MQQTDSGDEYTRKVEVGYPILILKPLLAIPRVVVS